MRGNSYLKSKEPTCKIDEVSSIKQKDVLSPLEFIQSITFYTSLYPKSWDDIIEILAVYIDVIATSTDELTPCKLSPHYIEIIKNSNPIKSKFYKLNKYKSDIHKEELNLLMRV